jgi:hypothetical protein
MGGFEPEAAAGPGEVVPWKRDACLEAATDRG